MRRHPFRPHKIEISESEGPILYVSGEWHQRDAKLWRPTPGELRKMVLDLKAHYNLSVAGVGALLGVPRATARKWIDRERNPCGSACRLIWLLWSTVKNPDVLDKPEAWSIYQRPGMKPRLVKLLEERQEAQSAPTGTSAA